MLNARHERVERYRLEHEVAVEATIVDVVRVPLAEVVIGPFARGVVEVVRARVDGQLFEQVGVEPGLTQQRGVGVVEDLERLLDQFAELSVGYACARDVQRDGPDPFVAVGLDLLLRFQHRNRPVADVHVDAVPRRGHDALRLVPRRALREDRLGNASVEERPPQLRGLQPPQKVAVKLSVSGPEVIDHHAQHAARLRGVGEGAALSLQLVEPREEPFGEDLHDVKIRRFEVRRSVAPDLDLRVQVAEVPQEIRVGRPLGVVEVPRNLVEQRFDRAISAARAGDRSGPLWLARVGAHREVRHLTASPRPLRRPAVR